MGICELVFCLVVLKWLVFRMIVNLHSKLLGKVEIKVPSLKEQEKIVEILEKQINDQENIVEKAENVIETIDVMKKSILAKAFRGELGTNIETEESAIELLKSIF